MYPAVIDLLSTPNTEQIFAQHCEAIHGTWKKLLASTTLPPGATAIKSLDDSIQNPESQNTLRLSYIRLNYILAGLRKKIQNDRKNGLIIGKASQRDATIAMDIYLKATGRTSRGKVYKIVSTANRWSAIAGQSPLLVVTFTNVAERLVNKSRMSIQRLQMLSEEISNTFPAALIVAADCLAKDAELAISSEVHHLGRTQDVLLQVRTILAKGLISKSE
ncbi:hypothetical protein V8F06_013889 [Rhypophila decipiens]